MSRCGAYYKAALIWDLVLISGHTLHKIYVNDDVYSRDDSKNCFSNSENLLYLKLK